jgi:hypothetical protein
MNSCNNSSCLSKTDVDALTSVDASMKSLDAPYIFEKDWTWVEIFRLSVSD